jgi:hypothetical protein
MKTVRLYTSANPEHAQNLLRQTPHSSGVWKDTKFYINDGPELCDFIVVFGGISEFIQSPIPKEHTLFVMGEPPSIKTYAQKFIAQFGSVISSNPDIIHPNKKMYQQGYPWFCGRQFFESGEQPTMKTYDDFKQDTQIKKTKLLSVVCSNKCSTSGHKQRFEFVRQLKDAFGDEIDLFGFGQNHILNKSDAIRPYKYHIVIENSVAPDYWTEKLADCYLEGAFPFYAGCPNLERYFPNEAYSLINLDNPDEAIRTIRHAIKEDWYKESVNAIHESKQLVLDHYNLFNLITDHITNTEPLGNSPKIAFRAYPSKWFKKGHLYRLKFRFRRLLRGVSGKSKTSFTCP